KDSISDENVNDAIASLELVSSELQNSVMKTRMQPIKKVFSRFPRVIRDLARQLNKDINLELIGEETDLDKSLVEALADPLIHLVRNAADHGIESPDERYKSGKSRQGKVTLSAKQEGDQILLTVSDDGKGMDHNKLRSIAVEKGMMSEDAASQLSDKEAFNLIFAAGFSTKTEISDVSGRGVGMDLVKTRINELSGNLEIDSTLGEGSIISIYLPLTLAILPTLMVKLNQYQFALPLSNVLEAFNMEPEQINVVDGQEVIRVRDKPLPLFFLNPWLVYGDNFNGAQTSQKVIVIQMGNQRFCLVVDHIAGQEEVVIKPLGSMLSHTQGFAGATITGDGSIALIIDVPSLITAYAANSMIY
ncbi:MAG: chemotaxis protein CheA, partial [Gammaproteobacteria bacterium]|nr:chemotaxis protein CheA [Gammaproteobacteria bacterium]